MVIRPGGEGYESARGIWNANVDKHPGIIARCVGVADVIDAVNFARDNNLLVAIRSGGHNVGGCALCDDGGVIDLSSMNSLISEFSANGQTPQNPSTRSHGPAN